MPVSFLFFFNSILFGIGLAMDAFSVSVANGIADPGMRRNKALLIAGVFGGFQTAMPLFGWLFVHTISRLFSAFHRWIPWIALILLAYIGGKMLYEGIRGEAPEEEGTSLGFTALLIQGIATSIDALSVGFTIADYDPLMALAESLIIGIVTFLICLAGLFLGKRIGARLAGRAQLLGGVILIAIGIEIFLTGI